MAVSSERLTSDATSSKADARNEVHRLQARVEHLEQVLAGRATADDVEARLQDFASAANGWLWEMDAGLRFTYFSANVYDITGVTPEWHYGKTREEIGSPESITDDEWHAHLEQLRQRQPFSNFVFRRQGPDGTKWMRTSGVPIFDDGGSFTGYRGTATDISAEVAAEHRAQQLLTAIESLNEIFVLWDADDRLVVCNHRFREINAKVVETTEPGTPFEDHIRAALAAGLYPNAADREEEWFADRVRRHKNPGDPFEMQRQYGRWILLTEQKLPDGSIATISTDITERKRVETALAEQNDILETALKTIPDGVQVLDRKLNLVAYNDQLFEVLDLDQSAILNAPNPGKAFRYALAGRGEYGPGDLEELVASREAIARSPKPVHYERQLVTGKWMECRGSPTDSGGYLAIYRDIDDRKRIYERLERLASIDALTQIYNRRKFLELASSEFDRARRYDRDMSILVIDIDHFKAINDRYGHAAGDEALVRAAETCRKTLRESDEIGRLGGEEFAVFLPESDHHVATAVVERLRLAVSEIRLTVDDATMQITVSVGVASVSATQNTVDAALADADAALYEAKRTGRNKVFCHRPG